MWSAGGSRFKSQQSASVAKKPNHNALKTAQPHDQKRWLSHYSPCQCNLTLNIICNSKLHKKKCYDTRMLLKEGTKAGKRARRHGLWGKAENTRAAQSEKWILWGILPTPCNFLQRGSWGYADVSPWEPMTRCKETAQRCIRDGSDWTLWQMSLLWKWSNIGSGFLERWLMPHSRRICTMPSLVSFTFWLALKGSGSWTRYLWRSLSAYLFSQSPSCQEQFYIITSLHQNIELLTTTA